MATEVKIGMHPQLGIRVRSDGFVEVYRPNSEKTRWFEGSSRPLGYKTFCLGGKTYRVHRIVAETFIPNPEEKPEIDHINRNPSDNRVENLRWVTRSEQLRNTKQNDGCFEKYGIHMYEDEKMYNRLKARRLRKIRKQEVA